MFLAVFYTKILSSILQDVCALFIFKTLLFMSTTKRASFVCDENLRTENRSEKVPRQRYHLQITIQKHFNVD